MQTTLDPTTQRRLDEVQRAQQEQDRQRAFEEKVGQWDKAMRRTFKGIVSAPERRRMLDRAAASQ